MTVSAFEGVEPSIDEQVYVDVSAKILGQVVIEKKCSIWPMVVVRGDVNSIYIGEETNVQDGSIVHVTHDGPFTPGGAATHIGQRVTIGHQAIIHACTIGDETLIGMGAKILDKAVVESHVMVGAGSLVPPGKVLTSGYLYVGSPARQVRPLTEDEIAQIRYSASYYYQLSLRHGA